MFKSLFLTWVLIFTTLPLHAEPAYPAQKVVYHINYNDPARLSATFNNISNHIQAVGEANIDLRAIVHGKAIEYFIAAQQDSDKQITLDTLRLSGARFIICGNSLDGYNITRDALYEVEADEVVQAGLPEIIRLQQQGFSYVNP
ncbi:DsrE family protein [Marinobacterium marinum]|uniref:DsrE family protein n=1 Tax=Marinobacterium marinum TaxID=2756129 RepID=A0A7W2ACV4_9GAMM|nr:DsrE family protein [Marinobacterium marinum]MBA4502513.1 DsrE family protein [Marinobacterium marinum]